MDTEHKVIVAIDFETANYGLESACALSMVRIVDGQENMVLDIGCGTGISIAIMDQEAKKAYGIDTARTYLIRPPNRHFRFTYIHGIRWDDVQDSPTFTELFYDISEFMKGADYLLAHNASFDRKVLKSCCDYWDLEFPEIPFLCTLKGCRRGLSLRKNSLDCVCSHLNIPLKHHDAASDALAAAKIFLHLRELGLSYADMRVK